MKSVPLVLSAKARELRAEFDASFARLPPPPPPASAALLLVTAGGETVAVRRTEMTGLARAENVTPVPGRASAFLGLAGLRGGLYPVWSLAGLLGRTSRATGDGWLLLTAAKNGAPCALVCEAFQRLVFVPEASLTAATPRGGPAGPAPLLAPCDGAFVPLIDLPALLAEIQNRKHPTPPRNPPS